MKSSEEKLVKDAVLLGVSNSVKVEKKKRDSEVGRPSSLSEEKMDQMLRLYYTRPYSFRELADMFGVSRMTIWRAVQTTQALVTTR